MIIRVLAFVAVASALRFLSNAILLEVFPGQVRSQTWIVPYLNMAGPDLLFFGLAGLVLPVIFRKYNLIIAALLCGIGIVVVQLVLFALFSSYSASGYQGYLVLTAPLFGAIAGLVVGILMSISISLLPALAKRRLSSG